MFRYSPDGELRGTYFRAAGLGPTVLEGARLFDGGGWVADIALVVENGVLTDIGPPDSVRRPAQAGAVDLQGRWLIPGLVDCGAYPVGRAPDEIARPQSSRFKSSGPILAHRAVADAHRMLSGGIIAVAQLGGADAEYVAGLRDAVRSGLLACPTVVSAGQALSPIGGGVEGWQEIGDDARARLPGTGILRRLSRQTAIVAETPDGLRKAVRRNFVDGADLVMLLLTSESASEQVALSEAELGAVVDEAQRVGARVACQATGNRPARAAVRAGVDLLVLGPSEPDDELVTLLAGGQTAWAPRLAGRPGGAGQRLTSAVKAVHEQGGQVVVSTGWRREEPVSFAAEVAALVGAGLPAAAVLQAATTGGARALGLMSGDLTAGEPANLVAFDVDPLADLSVLGEPGRARFILHSMRARSLTALQFMLGVKTAG